MATAASRYNRLKGFRQPYLDRARACAKLTIPALMPPEGASAHTQFSTPYQSVGARGVNNLASKFLLALMPPNTSMFRLVVDDFTLEELAQQEGMRAQVEEALGKIERSVNTEIESVQLRVTGFETFKQLINSGNALLVMPDDKMPRCYRLDRYVVKRDSSGNVLEVIIEEWVAPSALPPDVQTLLPAESLGPEAQDKSVPIYTCMRREGKKWRMYQEINDKAIPGTESISPLDTPPMLPLRFIKVDGEDYGRSYVEEYHGDLKTLEGLEKAIVQGAAAAAKVLFLVNPNGTTSHKIVAEAPSGAVRPGNSADVTVLQLQKHADFRVAAEKSGEIQQRLAFAFLMNSAIQRPGERVTAEEIRYMARELEDALGGIYSILAQEFQLPLVRRLMSQMQRKRRLPRLPEGKVRPVIVTGIEALGRGHDLAKLDQLVMDVKATFGEAGLRYISIGNYLKRKSTNLGLDAKGLVRSDEEIAQEDQAAQQAAMQQSMVDKGVGPVAKVAAEAMAAQQPPTQ